MQTQEKQKSARFALRACGMFVILAAVVAVIYWFGYNGYATVGEWDEPGDHAAFTYEGEVYRRSGVWGEGILTKKKYPMGDLLGKIKENGDLTTTVEAETSEPVIDEADSTPVGGADHATETESYRVLSDEVVSLVSGRHTVLVYAVEKKADYLIIWESDGLYYLYYREAVGDPLAG